MVTNVSLPVGNEPAKVMMVINMNNIKQVIDINKSKLKEAEVNGVK